MTALYLCYHSILDPLIQTQVVAYLEGLAQAGYRLVLLTFEPRPVMRAETQEWRDRLRGKGIAWHWLRYHKRPTVPATGWDIMRGVVAGVRLARRYDVSLLHARAHVPGAMALMLKRLTGARLLLDIRGFMAEEYVDAGLWRPRGMLFRTTKAVERSLIKTADGLVVLTRKAKALLQQWYPQESAGKSIQVIPCCVDLRAWSTVQRAESEEPGVPMTLVYVGKLGGWYMTEAMAAFVAAARHLLPDLRWQVWTQSDPTGLRQIAAAWGLEGCIAIGRVPWEALPRELGGAQAGLSLIKPCLSKLASSPTKIGEYLAAGLPVVSNAGIGDVDELLQGSRSAGPGAVGVIVREFTREAYREAAHELLQLLTEPGIRERCRATAERHLDLVKIGWARYRSTYESLIPLKDS